MNRTSAFGNVVSLIAMIAVLAVVTILFYRVMIGFALPLFMAVVLVIIFRPVHERILSYMPDRNHLAAGCTTLAILLIVLAPLTLIFYQAALETWRVARVMAEEPGDTDRISGALAVARLLDDAIARLPLDITAEQREEALHYIATTLGEWALAVLGFTAKFLIGLAVMIVALFFFLADGPKMFKSTAELLPIESDHLQRLVEQFTTVTRAVVVATLAAAIIQGLLAGIGFWATGFQVVFLLTAATILLALVPFVGPAAVWLPCALYLFFYEQDTWRAVGLAIYGAAIVSMADNVIRPVVLQGRSRLHPLLALLSVIGGLQVMGPIGIFVGPIVVVVLQTLMKIVHDQLFDIDRAWTMANRPAERRRAKQQSELAETARQQRETLRPLLRRVRMAIGKRK